MKYWAFWCFCLLAMGGCSGQGGPDVTQAEESAVEETTDEIAQQIIDAAIEKHGGSKYRDCRVQFNFRDKFYLAIREGSKFQYERIFTDSSGAEIRDVLTSEGFFREIEGQRVQLSEKDSSAYANSVNSVIYFALLPYFLNDPAVIKKYAGEVTIKGKPYQKVRVTFRREGGGKDFEDEYMYWIHRDEHTMDYLAYNFHVNGGGARFREAYAFRTSNGIRFANYHNYKPKADNRNVAEFDSLFENDGLEKVSDIELDHVRVVLDYW